MSKFHEELPQGNTQLMEVHSLGRHAQTQWEALVTLPGHWEPQKTGDLPTDSRCTCEQLETVAPKEPAQESTIGMVRV